MIGAPYFAVRLAAAGVSVKLVPPANSLCFDHIIGQCWAERNLDQTPLWTQQYTPETAICYQGKHREMSRTKSH